jgi:integral membrane protein
MEGALRRYRVLAGIVSVLLIVLVLVGVPLKYAGGHPGVAKWVGLVHGMLFYPLFLLVTVDLGWRTRMPIPRLVLAMVLGTVPVASIWAEQETTRWVRARRPTAEAVSSQLAS